MTSDKEQGQCLLSFPTLVYRHSLRSTGWHDEVVDFALRGAAEGPGVVVSQVRGWHSSGNVFQQLEAQLAPLRQAIGKALGVIAKTARIRPTQHYWLEGWINVLGEGGYHRVHQHPGAAWSGTYYLAVGEGAGDLEILDPRPPAFGDRAADCLRISPASGMLVMFPGWCSHWVTPNQGATPRVSLAFNVYWEQGSNAVHRDV